MEKIFHPVTGEEGYFYTESEKEVIDIAVKELKSSAFPMERDIND